MPGYHRGRPPRNKGEQYPLHRVLRCARVGEPAGEAPRRVERDVVRALDEFTLRLAVCADYEAATRVALETLDDLFDFSPAILLVRDPRAERLFAVASNGYPRSGAGATVATPARSSSLARRSSITIRPKGSGGRLSVRTHTSSGDW